MKKVLWVSRHPVLSSQKEVLKTYFGDDMDLVIYPDPFDSARDIVEKYKSTNCDDMVVVAPYSVIHQLNEIGIKPIWAQMEEVSGPEYDTIVGNRLLKFTGFYRAEISFKKTPLLKGDEVSCKKKKK